MTLRVSRAAVLAALTVAAFGSLVVPTAFAAAGTSRDAADIEHFLEPYFKPDETGCAVIVVRDGATVFRKAFGLADLATRQALRPDSVLPLGSITKQFTAAAILLLAQDGKLTLDDDVREYLPDYPAAGQSVTIEALLTHTAGVPNFSFHAVRHTALSTAQLIDLFRNKPLDFAPGSRWKYSNSGYDLLGAIVERASGMPYASFVERRIFKPLGMAHSHYGFQGDDGANAIAGHERSSVGFQRVDPVNMDSLFAAGALTSNVDDLARWNAALDGDRLLDTTSRGRMFANARLSNGAPTGYGFGWVLSDRAGEPRAWHNGSFDGFYAVVTRLPADHVYVAILGNVQNPRVPLEYLAERIASIAAGKARPQVEVPQRPDVLDAYAGVYGIDDASTLVVRRVGSRLRAQRSGGDNVEFLPASRTEFFRPDALDRLRFVVDHEGGVRGVEFTSPRGFVSVAQRTDAPLPQLPVKVRLTLPALQAMVGDYELRPDLILRLRIDDDRILVRAGMQEETAFFPASDTALFTLDQDARITLDKSSDGHVVGLVFHQGSASYPAKRIR